MWQNGLQLEFFVGCAYRFYATALVL